MSASLGDAPLLPAGLTSKLRIVKRSRQVSAVLLSYGLNDLLGRLHLPAWLASDHAAAEERGAGSTPRRVREAFEELGPTFVKLGQFLSTRNDLLSDEWTEELAQLQDAVRPVEWEDIEQQLRSSFGERLVTAFASIDEEPLAAGSVAQIHRAELADGTQVVLKILRPGIRGVIRSDLEVLGLLATFSERHGAQLGIRPSELVQEFAQDRMAELDLFHEGRATDRLRRLFLDDPAHRLS